MKVTLAYLVSILVNEDYSLIYSCGNSVIEGDLLDVHTYMTFSFILSKMVLLTDP